MPVLEAACLTAADYQRLTPPPGLGPQFQLVDGELLPMAAPTVLHQEILLNLCVLISIYLRTNRVGRIYPAPCDVYLDEHNVFQPDILYVSRERASLVAKEGVRGAPDLVVEILSPSSKTLDRRKKQAIYARLGVRELWLIDPDTRTLEVFDLEVDPEHPAAEYCEGSGPQSFETRLLPGLRIALADVFPQW